MAKLTKILLFMMLVWAMIGAVNGQDVLPSPNPAIDCSIWGTYIWLDTDFSKIGICQISPEKIPAFLNTQLSKEQKALLYLSNPPTYFCLVKTFTRNDIQRSANFHIRPHEGSPILLKHGLPYNSELEGLEFIRKPAGSSHNWVKAKYIDPISGKALVGYVGYHTVWCNREEQ